MKDLLSLRDADEIAAEMVPVLRPGLVHVFLGMIRSPHRTLREAFEHPIQAYALVFAGAGGIYWILNMAIARAGGGSAALAAILAGIVLAGIPAGIAYMYALTILLDWSCDILGGRPSRKKIRMMLAYAGVPGLVALALFAVPKIAIFGRALFLPERAWLSANPIIVWGLWFGDAICFAWSLLLVIRSLKIMNGFSTGRAMLAAALPLGPVALIGVLFMIIVASGVFFAPPAF